MIAGVRRILIYNSSRATKGGGITFLKGLISVLKRYGYNVEVVANHAPSYTELLNMLREVDVVCWYGESSVGDGLRLLKFACSMSKPVLRILGGPVFIRKPDRPSYLLSNALSAFNIFISTTIHPTLFYVVRNVDDYKLLKRFSIPAFHMPSGIDTKSWKPAKKDNDRFMVICNAAPATWCKGTDLLLRIVPKILPITKENILLVIVTGGLGQFQFRRRLASFERMFPSRVLCIDRWLSRKEMRKLLSKAHLLLFPSRLEGFGNLVLEAQSCGVLVVAFDIPGAPRDVVIPNLTGSLAKPYDIKDFVEKVHRLYMVWRTEQELYINMQMKARRNALRFDWDVVGKIFMYYVEEACSKSAKNLKMH